MQNDAIVKEAKEFLAELSEHRIATNKPRQDLSSFGAAMSVDEIMSRSSAGRDANLALARWLETVETRWAWVVQCAALAEQAKHLATLFQDLSMIEKDYGRIEEEDLDLDSNLNEFAVASFTQLFRQ